MKITAYTTHKKAVALRQAETAAKAAHLRIWKDYTAPVVTGTKVFTGVVTEVITGDTFVVAVDGGGAGAERKLHLSSTRAPYPGRRDGEGAEPWGFEAKEWLRKNLIGRPVQVKIDYQRGGPQPTGTSAAAAAAGAGAGAGAGDGAATVAAASAPATKNAPRKEYATVRLASRKSRPNVAELLINDGLATAMRHGAADDKRSSCYDALVAAQSRAEAAKKRMHSGRTPPQRRVQNLIGQATKARTFLTFLQRERTIRGVVEYVHGGGRVKLFLPSQNCVLNFALAGLRCPATARRSGPVAQRGKDEKGGPEAHAMTKAMCLQRDVEVQVETMDKRGCAIGSLYVGHGGQRRSLGVELLKKGYAKTNWADRTM